MPIWGVQAREYDLPRNLALLDTNVLVAMFHPEDARHDEAVVAINDLGEFHWAVSEPVIVEAWNFLAGKVGRTDYAVRMMQWLLTPGNVTLIGDESERVEVAHAYSVTHRLDIVDAWLLDIADRISRTCNIVPAVHVATYDVRDFLRLWGQGNLSFNVYDMRDLSSTVGI
jgi:predicted nucleic acid-binding protein